jgi:hypothetical protein
METSPEPDDLRPEYDFRTMRGVVRGKYAARYQERLRVIRLAEDVAAAFANETAVNAALSSPLKYDGFAQRLGLRKGLCRDRIPSNPNAHRCKTNS